MACLINNNIGNSFQLRLNRPVTTKSLEEFYNNTLTATPLLMNPDLLRWGESPQVRRSPKYISINDNSSPPNGDLYWRNTL